MYQINHLEDTIVAIITPPGIGGIGVVRLSGKDVLKICDQIFFAKNKVLPSTFRNFSVHYGWVINPQQNHEIIDEVLLTVMRSPKSYTREDVAEISCHGGTVSVRRILSLAVELGARIAEPGEFTKRAFLNGRIDLTQAEAVLDIVRAKTDAFLQVSLNQLKGNLSVDLESIRESLMKIYVELEAIVNFPEDDVDSLNRAQILNSIEEVYKRIQKLLKTSDHGRVLKEGIKIVLCGRPNVGKSSLLNALLRQKRAIVSDIAGTTRDTLEETAQIKGIPLQLIDTAGILEPRDLIEVEAIDRSRLAINSADLVLLILDGQSDLTDDDRLLIDRVKDKNTFIVINKCDVTNVLDVSGIQKILPGKKILSVSALKHIGLEDLENTLVNQVWQETPTNWHDTTISNIRHINALKEGANCLNKAVKAMQEGLSVEFVSEEIKSAVNFLDSITGRNIDSDLLEKIFAEFCIGK